MEITKDILDTIKWKIIDFHHRENIKIQKDFIEQKEKSKEVQDIKLILKSIKDIIKTLPAIIVDNDHCFKRLISYDENIAEIFFQDELNKELIDYNYNNLDFEIALMAGSSKTILELIEKVENKYNVKIV